MSGRAALHNHVVHALDGFIAPALCRLEQNGGAFAKWVSASISAHSAGSLDCSGTEDGKDC